MSKYIKLFETNSEYEEYINGEGAILPNVSFCEDEKDVHYNPVPYDYSQDYFTMVITAGGDITWTGISSYTRLSYSTDDGATWSTAGSSITLTVNEGDKVLWKGTTSPSSSGNKYGIGKFSGDTNVRYFVEGNIMSLLFGDNFEEQTSLANKKYAFYNLFSGNKNITSAENLSLPATTLAQYCYGDMFYDCINLTTAPKLSATTLGNSCYSYMFNNCTSLTTAPSILPATTLEDYCYQGMFNNCTSLTTAPKLPATTLASMCYGTMFRGCTSLTTAPELPATTLTNTCYYLMFYDCTSLSSIKCLATNISEYGCTDSWVSGVAASGTFTKDASMTKWKTKTGTNGIPSGWTVEDAA